ncbi:MAG TPA: hypothetical protein PK447_04440 [Ignavibacteria bacterium]|nr:hypothetical protein [Ignavibacteria bacterium]
MNYEKIIIIDTCTYFRLSKGLHPFLSNKIGKDNYTPCVLKDLNKDLKRNNNLKNKFAWIEEKEYINNREKNLFKKKSAIENGIINNYKFISMEASDNGINLSDVDKNCINYAYTYGSKLATDDAGMILVCKEFGVQYFKTLDILYLLFDNKQITTSKLKSIIDFWYYLNDLPGEFQKDFKNIFKKPYNEF